MEIITLDLFIVFALFLVALIDLKYKAIPSVFMTSLLFMVAIANISNIGSAVLLLIFGLLIQDIYHDRILGMADFKAFAIIGFLLYSTLELIIFIVIFLIFQIAWAFVTRKLLKSQDREVPFLIVFFLAYMTFYIVKTFSWI